MHRFLLHNGQVHDASAVLLTPGQVGVLNGWGVFSTLRVRDGVLFAFERHHARMQRDAALLRVPFEWTAEALHAALLKLVEANEARNATLRVAVIRNRGGMWEGPGVHCDADLVAFTAPLNDWGGAVKLGVVAHARHAASPFAGTKVLSWSQNLVWYEEAHHRGFDEVVLLNERGEVSECTSANLFIARGVDVLTPPLASGCLPGVTRELLVNAEVSVPGIQVREESLLLKDLENADEVFITSTTRDLLPVAEVEGLTIRQGQNIRQALQVAFSRYMDAYVQARLAVAGGR
ncbi:MAG TPA: class IV aminotransferase [Solibacterales bacterium]|nr:class IV aminotransferase [Bryobacterales bacterium]